MNNTPTSILNKAAGLLTVERGTNPEYDRALVDLCCDLLGLGTDEYRGEVEAALYALQALNLPS